MAEKATPKPKTPRAPKNLKVEFKKVVPDARLPEKAYEGDAGWDVFAAKKIIIPGNGQTKLVPVGFKMAIPDGFFARIEGRGSVHAQTTLIHKGTPIDSGYRGDVYAIVGNAGDYPITIEKGDKFGQLVYYPVLNIEHTEIKEDKDFTIPFTERGEGGQGSSDKK